VQNDDQRRLWREVAGDERKHPEIAWIGTETRDLNQRAAAARSHTPTSEAIDSIQLWQTPQEFNIFSEGHRQLLGETLTTPVATDSCCTAK
jgi:hypothetical protein